LVAIISLYQKTLVLLSSQLFELDLFTFTTISSTVKNGQIQETSQRCLGKE
jgi:hypothetical protein